MLIHHSTASSSSPRSSPLSPSSQQPPLPPRLRGAVSQAASITRPLPADLDLTALHGPVVVAAHPGGELVIPGEELVTRLLGVLRRHLDAVVVPGGGRQA